MNHESTLAIISDLDHETLSAHLLANKEVIDIDNIDAVKSFILNYLKTNFQAMNEIIHD